MKKGTSFSNQKHRAPELNKGLLYLALSLILLVGCLSGQNVYAQSSAENTISTLLISEGSTWHYYKGVEKPPQKWTHSGFDQSSWQEGQSGFGYGAGANRTYLADMQGNYSTLYVRQEFMVNKIQNVTGLILSVSCDGPFIAYLNGIEVIRTNTIQLDNMSQAEQFNISGFKHELFPRDNVLALECNNDDISSDVFSFVPTFEVFESEEVLQ